MPRTVGDFVGRTEEIDALVEAVSAAQCTLVGIEGMAGVGKTTLALHLATGLSDQYPDGQLFVDLHGHSDQEPTDPTAALRLLLLQVGTEQARIPDELAERAAVWRSAIAVRRMLVVLDNAHSSEQVEPLLALATGDCRCGDDPVATADLPGAADTYRSRCGSPPSGWPADPPGRCARSSSGRTRSGPTHRRPIRSRSVWRSCARTGYLALGRDARCGSSPGTMPGKMPSRSTMAAMPRSASATST